MSVDEFLYPQYATFMHLSYLLHDLQICMRLDMDILPKVFRAARKRNAQLLMLQAKFYFQGVIRK